jgi:hypothetical protein
MQNSPQTDFEFQSGQPQHIYWENPPSPETEATTSALIDQLRLGRLQSLSTTQLKSKFEFEFNLFHLFHFSISFQLKDYFVKSSSSEDEIQLFCFVKKQF